MRDDYRFETEGTGEWFCNRLGVPRLYDGLAYRVSMRRGREIVVQIFDPNVRTRYGRNGKTLATHRCWLQRDDDWRDRIADCARQAAEALEDDESERAARNGEHLYFGTFEFKPIERGDK